MGTWVHRRRDHGGVIFIDLRDRYGLTHVKFDLAIDKGALQKANDIRSEWVLKIVGNVLACLNDMIKHKLKTGEVEIGVNELEILNKSKTPSFEIDEEKAEEAN